MSTLEARLYLDQMDLSAYWPKDALLSWNDFFTRFEEDKTTLDTCSFLSPAQKQAFRIALEPQTYLPSIPSIDVPQPIAPGLFPLNEPDQNGMVIVTGNSQLTFDVLASIWAQGLTPGYLLVVDCLGNTVDMAMVYQNFTPERLQQALDSSGLDEKTSHRHLIVPGFTSSLAKDFQTTTGWEIEVGPVCAAELPLFLGERWIPSRQ